ncbi:MAG: hypothetical protein Q9176_006612 [Flavoplaca citrina]
MCPATDNPTHPFCITKKGEDLYRRWRFEQLKRDAEVFGVVGDVEFTGHGTQEVIENIVYISDHSTTNLIQLIGTALLTTIDLLTTNHLFHPDSSIRNIGFILGLFLEFVTGYEEACEGDEDGWRFVVVRRMDAVGVEVSGTERVVGIVEGLREIVQEEAEQRGREGLERRDGGSVDKKGGDGVGLAKDGEDDGDTRKKVPNFVNAYRPDSDLEAECREWCLWDWRVELAAYTTHHSTNTHIGGTRYDLTLAENWESESEESE